MSTNNDSGPGAGPAAPTQLAGVWGRPVAGVHLGDAGWLGAWTGVNRESTLPHCIRQLEAHGSLANLRRVVGEHDGPRIGFMFSDSDVYKVLEAAAWEAQRALEAGARETPLDGTEQAFVTDAVVLLARVQREDGVLNSFTQTDGRQPWSNLRWDHELYCYGHLIQAAVAWRRAAAGQRGQALARELLAAARDLFRIAVRAADMIVARWRDGLPIVGGHPEAESALVELARETGRRDYLEAAVAMIEARGFDTLGTDPFGPAYFQDHEPVTTAHEAAGHAVRQLYLLAGVVDAAVETGDADLLAAAERIWASAHQTKMHITGGMGSRHRDEAFGDPYELPPDRGYAETCAAIADWMLSWRLLLATGRSSYGAAMDRALQNAIRAAVDDAGTSFFYSCPLQMRTHRTGAHEQAPAGRAPWYECACCPPNIARLLASVRHAVAADTGDGVALLMPVDAAIPVGNGVITVASELPAAGGLSIRHDGGRCAEPLMVRVPDGAVLDPADVTVNAAAGVPAEEADGVALTDGWLRVPAGWTAVEITFGLPVEVVTAHPRADALRGQRAITRAGLVYALEGTDLPDDVELEDVSLLPGEPVPAPAVSGSAPALRVRLRGASRSDQDPLYGTVAPGQSADFESVLVPFGEWGRRGAGPTRVWIPAAG